MGRNFELLPSSCNTGEAGAQTETLSVLSVMTGTQTGKAHLQHTVQDSSHYIPEGGEGGEENREVRLMHSCLSWLVGAENDITTHSKKDTQKNKNNPQRIKLLNNIILDPHYRSEMLLG